MKESTRYTTNLERQDQDEDGGQDGGSGLPDVPAEQIRREGGRNGRSDNGCGEGPEGNVMAREVY